MFDVCGSAVTVVQQFGLLCQNVNPQPEELPCTSLLKHELPQPLDVQTDACATTEAANVK